MFDLDKGKLIIKVQDLMLPDFNILYKKDKSTSKKDANDLLLYVHIVSQIDGKAPYANENPSHVRGLAKKMIFKKFDYKFSSNKLIKDEKLLDKIIELYVETCITPARAVLLSYNNKIYEFKQMIDETKPEITKNTKFAKQVDPDGEAIIESVTYSTNSDMLRKIMVELESIITARDKMAQMAENEAAKVGKVKANQKKSFLEKMHGD